MQDPWTLYWQSDCLDSCVATQSSQDAAAVRTFWQDSVATFEPGSRILDLATGNGTVPTAMLEANDSLQVTGVDKAEIDPQKFLSAPGVLASANFLGGVDICSIPFADGEFDVVSSQFGIEYAPLDEAVPEAVRVLKRGGDLWFLMHHAESEIVKPARVTRREMNALLHEGGVLQALKSYVLGRVSEDALETAGQAHLASDAGRSSAITGQIFEGVNRVVVSMSKGEQQAGNELCEVMLLRLGADRDRLRQLENAALTQSEFDDLVGLLETAGMRTVAASALVANEGTDDEFVIGWQYRGHKD